MRIIRSKDEFDEIFSISEYPDDYHLKNGDGFEEHTERYSTDELEHEVKTIWIDGARIHFVDKTNRVDFGYFVRTDRPYMQMHFEFGGGAFYTAQDIGGMNCAIPEGFHTLFYFPALYGSLVYPVVKRGFAVEIEISLSYLERVLGGEWDVLGDFMTNVRKERPVMLGGNSFPITPRMKQVLMDIYQCQFQVPLKRLLVESRLMELLCLQIEQMAGTASLTTTEHLKNEKTDKMEMVKKIIEDHLSNPPSIDELSKKVGVNRTRLQSDFKRIYGTTIFSYLTDLRMEIALKMLLNKRDTSIYEVARLVGYKYPNHFSAAFKRKYGYVPSSILKRKI